MNIISSPVFPGENISQTPLLIHDRRYISLIKSSATHKNNGSSQVLRFPICRRSPLSLQSLPGQLEASTLRQDPVLTVSLLPTSAPPRCRIVLTRSRHSCLHTHFWMSTTSAGMSSTSAYQPGPCPTGCRKMYRLPSRAHESEHCPGTNWPIPSPVL